MSPQATAATTTTKGKKGKKVPAGREMKYPEVKADVRRGNTALTVEDAKTLLGYEEVPDQKDSLGIADPHNKYFRTTRNTKNRPVYRSHLDLLMQEHLNRRWRVNGEAIVIGKYGEVLSGQHRLLSLIFAEMEREKKKIQWQHFWSTPVTMETVLVVGIDEDDDVINTLDTGKPRTFPDVLYRSPYYADEVPGERKKLCQMTEYALQLLWRRTRVRSRSSWVQERSHAESIDFLQRHSKLWEKDGCVRYMLALVDEFEDGLKGKIGAGTAAGLLYLMAASGTDTKPGDATGKNATGYYGMYASEGSPSEKEVDFKNMEKAKDFWRRFLSGEEAVAGPILQAISELEEGDRTATKDEWIAVIIYAWQRFLATGRIKLTSISLKDVMARREKSGKLYLPEEYQPKIGGIDLGDESHDPKKPKSPKKSKAAKAGEGEEGEIEEDEDDTTEGVKDDDSADDEEEEEEDDDEEEDEELKDDWGQPVQKEEDEEDDEEEEEEEPQDELEEEVPALSEREIEKRGIQVRDEKVVKKNPKLAKIPAVSDNGEEDEEPVVKAPAKPKGGKKVVRKP